MTMTTPTARLARALPPASAALLADALAGLAARPRTLPCKHFYDKAGSVLFDQICELPEYYLTRAEARLLEQHGDDLARAIGASGILVEPGAGSATKTRALLDRLPALARYVPLDISAQHLHDTAAALRAAYPRLAVTPIVADYSQALPEYEALHANGAPVTVFFPGASLGNFEPWEPDGAVALLTRMRRLAGPRGRVLLGTDLGVDPAAIAAAYDDDAGVTAAFNKNLLVRLRDELGADVDVDAFVHEAAWQPDHRRVEMRLVSTCDQTVRLAGRAFAFTAGEAIVTEHCYKLTAEQVWALARRAGLAPARCWLGPDGMAMHELVPVVRAS